VTNIQKLGSVAAFINAIVSIATLLVAIFLIGLSALADASKFVDLAINNPTPLIIQDLLKFVSAASGCVLILALSQCLYSDTPKLILFANIFGSFSLLCLVTNGVLSIYTISQASLYAKEIYSLGGQLNAIIGLLAVTLIVFNGLWLLLVSWSALKSNRLPKFFCYLGLGMGFLSLIPQLGIFVLILSVIWSVWLGRLLWRDH
jgi:Domain of unknown function (DUF4386)